MPKIRLDDEAIDSIAELSVLSAKCMSYINRVLDYVSSPEFDQKQLQKSIKKIRENVEECNRKNSKISVDLLLSNPETAKYYTDAKQKYEDV